MTVKGAIFDGALQKLQKGISLSGTKTKPARVKRLANNTFRITLTEGRNRQIRRMCQKVGSPVVALKRVRIENITDSVLREGELRPLTEEERSGVLERTMQKGAL
ncbi:MAG: Pseudouridine synthase [Candidatus Peribacteria bacterium GW2011_GWC2_54_8]|nr:MAG: Pseudouridine synthase [Candidatus Peribacteria bacterium GW2011_GWC2_54_8]